MVNNTFQLIEEHTDAVDQPPTWVGALRGLPLRRGVPGGQVAERQPRADLATSPGYSEAITKLAPCT